MMELSDRHSPLSSSAKRKSWLIAVAVSVISITAGFNGAYTSAAIPDINSHPNPVHLSTEVGSWFSSLQNLGGIFGGFVGGLLADRYGRKCALMLNAVPFVSGWLLIIAAVHPAMLLFGRFLTGCCTITNNILVPLYVTEFAPKTMRGGLAALHTLGHSLGFMVVHIAAFRFSWQGMINVNLTIVLISVVLLQFVPESPRWLLANGFSEGARYVLQRMRCDNNVEGEIIEIQERLTATKKKLPLRDFIKKPLIKPLALSMALFIFQSICGYDYFLTYILQIFLMTGTEIGSIVQSLVVGVAMIIGNIGAILLLDRIGRRWPLIISSWIMTIFMALMAIFFKLQHTNEYVVVTYMFWMPVVSVCLFVVVFNVAWGVVPVLMINELFPLRARAHANSMCMIAAYASAFLVTKLPPTIQKSSIGITGVYAIFTIILGVITIFACFWIPETKGRTLEEIEMNFQ